ncbi:MAG: hypothetical protein EA364_10950 [Balneolaceae bacterium]|nr:MAG: hypothetical protein EA364_10950 [Balneolaceae bacterium]
MTEQAAITGMTDHQDVIIVMIVRQETTVVHPAIITETGVVKTTTGIVTRSSPIVIKDHFR